MTASTPHDRQRGRIAGTATQISQRPHNPSPRQRRILRRLADGMTQPEIAADDGVPPHQVRRQLEILRNRFAATNCALIAIALRLEWFAVEIELH